MWCSDSLLLMPKFSARAICTIMSFTNWNFFYGALVVMWDLSTTVSESSSCGSLNTFGCSRSSSVNSRVWELETSSKCGKIKSHIWCLEDRASWYIRITKPTRCTNFSNLFLEWNSACFGQSGCPSSGIQHCTRSDRYMSYRFCWLFASGIRISSILIPLASSRQNLYDIYLLLRVQCWTPDDGQTDCPKHAVFHPKSKFEKSVHLVGFVIRIKIVV